MPVFALLFRFPVREIWLAVSSSRSRVKDLEDYVLVFVLLGPTVLGAIGILLAWGLDLLGAGNGGLLLLQPAILVATHGLGWYVGEMVSGHKVSLSAGASTGVLVRASAPHALVGWSSYLLLNYFMIRT